MLSGPVRGKCFHRVRRQEFVRAILTRVRQKEGALLIPDRAAPVAAWEILQDLLISGQGLRAVVLIVTIVESRTPAAVHIPVAVALLVAIRLILIAVVELLLPVVVFLVAVGFPVVPAAVSPVPVAVVAEDRVPDKWQIKPDS